MVWYPSDFAFHHDHEIYGKTDSRYVLIDKTMATVWKIYTLPEKQGSEIPINTRHFEREKQRNQELRCKPHENLMLIKEENRIQKFRCKADGKQYGVLIFDFLPYTLEKEPSINYTDDGVATLAYQMLSGISHLHELNIAHRDIKPANIFIDKNGIVKIADYNISLNEGSGCLGSDTGTLRYMHPRQLFESECHRQDDLWSLGVVLWELVTRSLLVTKPYRYLRCCQPKSTELCAKQASEMLNEALRKKGRKLSASFQTFASGSHEIRPPVGLESVYISETPIYREFRNRGPSFSNQATEADFDFEQFDPAALAQELYGYVPERNEERWMFVSHAPRIVRKWLKWF
ncbi:unnamed protein product, partial [Mesorhabditis spiculigera]